MWVRLSWAAGPKFYFSEFILFTSLRKKKIRKVLVKAVITINHFWPAMCIHFDVRVSTSERILYKFREFCIWCTVTPNGYFTFHDKFVISERVAQNTKLVNESGQDNWHSDHLKRLIRDTSVCRWCRRVLWKSVCCMKIENNANKLHQRFNSVAATEHSNDGMPKPILASF